MIRALLVTASIGAVVVLVGVAYHSTLVMAAGFAIYVHSTAPLTIAGSLAGVNQHNASQEVPA